MFLRAKTWSAPFCLIACLLGACDRKPDARQSQAPALRQAAAAKISPARAAAPEDKSWFTQGAAQGASLGLAYTHEVGLSVAGGAMTAHFDAARDRCLNTPALHCILLRAELGTVAEFPAGAALRQHGSLALRLPHDQIAAYAAALTEKLPGEPAGLVTVQRQSMVAEDLSQPIADTGQRIAQLQSYLASLKALGDRLTIGVGDLVKIAAETARTQTEIEAAQAVQRTLSRQVDTEELDIDFEEPAPSEPPHDPVAETWTNARATLARNEAAALETGIAALPWAPLALAVLILVWLLRVVLWGRRRR